MTVTPDLLEARAIIEALIPLREGMRRFNYVSLDDNLRQAYIRWCDYLMAFADESLCDFPLSHLRVLR